MAKLIDTERYETTLQRFAEHLTEAGKLEAAEAVRSLIKGLKIAPTVDAEEVVRCKDYQHWLKDVPGCTDFVGRCEWANYMVGAVGFCVYGERKDND